MDTVKSNVYKLLTAQPSLADNYNNLLISYWVIFDRVSTVADIKNVTPAETITRCARFLVSNNAVELSEESKRNKKEQEEHYKYEFASLA